MLPTFNYNTFISSMPLYNKFLFTKAFVKETCSQAMSMIPGAITAFSGSPTLQLAANLTCGSFSLIKGIEGYKSVYENKNEDSGFDRFTKTIASTRDIGIGCLLVVAELTQSPEAKNGIKTYYLLGGFLQFTKALMDGNDKNKTPEQTGQALAKFLTGYFKLSAMIQTFDSRNINSNTDDALVFSRYSYLDSNTQVSTISQKAFGIIQTKCPKEEILFNEASLIPFDNAGTCSAMALDFVSRYNTKCKDVLDQIACVKEFKDYYAANTHVYSSVQAAFNTINVIGSKSSEGLPPSDMIAHQKMQSLANYHSLTLTPVTKTFNTGHDNEAIRNELDNLDWGTYVIRMIKPASNHKEEVYGHTMGFIKNKDQSFFYDNSKGLRKLSNLPEDIIENLWKWRYIPTLRIYKAECPSTGCENLNEVKTG